MNWDVPYMPVLQSQLCINPDAILGSSTAGSSDLSRSEAILLHRLLNAPPRWRVVASERQFIFLVDWLSSVWSFPITCSSDNLTRSEYLPFNNQFTCYLSNYTVKAAPSPPPLPPLLQHLPFSRSSLPTIFQIITHLKPIFSPSLRFSLRDNYNI